MVCGSASGGAGPFQFVVADVDDVPASLVFDAVVASAWQCRLSAVVSPSGCGMVWSGRSASRHAAAGEAAVLVAGAWVRASAVGMRVLPGGGVDDPAGGGGQPREPGRVGAAGQVPGVGPRQRQPLTVAPIPEVGRTTATVVFTTVCSSSRSATASARRWSQSARVVGDGVGAPAGR